MPATQNAIYDFEGIVESSMELAAPWWLLAVSFVLCLYLGQEAQGQAKLNITVITRDDI